jgi:hypothetical protein
MSINGRPNGAMEHNNMNDSIHLWQELERVKRENEELVLYKDKNEREKCNYGSNLGILFNILKDIIENNLELKEEVMMLHEESVMKNE